MLSDCVVYFEIKTYMYMECFKIHLYHLFS